MWNEAGGARFKRLMRRPPFVLLLLALLSLLPARAEETEGVPPLLLDALTKYAADFDHWAYTETRTTADEHGVPQSVAQVRFDPSRPYGVQYQPLLIDGKPPTKRQLESYRRRGEKRGDKLLKDEEEGRTASSRLQHFSIDGGKASVDLAHATVVAEDAASVTYEVPMRNDGRATFPIEKVQLLVRVNRAGRVFEHVDLRQRESIRLKLVFKITGASGGVDFAPVNATHAPAVVRMRGDFSATLLFMKLEASFESKRADFKRVKPYSERFGVKIGPMKALNF